MHECALPGTGGAHNGDELTGINLDADAGHRVDRRITQPVWHDQIDRFNDFSVVHCVFVPESPVLTTSPCCRPDLISALTWSSRPTCTYVTVSFPLFMTKTAYWFGAY